MPVEVAYPKRSGVTTARGKVMATPQNSEVRRSGRRPCPSKAVLIECAAPNCQNTEKTVDADGEAFEFFPMPTKRAIRTFWIKAIPELAYAETPNQQKVCSKHFVDGHPSDDYPYPCLGLGGDDRIPPPFHEETPKSLKKEKENIRAAVKRSIEARAAIKIENASPPPPVLVPDSTAPTIKEERPGSRPAIKAEPDEELDLNEAFQPAIKRARALKDPLSDMDFRQPMSLPSSVGNSKASPTISSPSRITSVKPGSVPSYKTRVLRVGGLGGLGGSQSANEAKTGPASGSPTMGQPTGLRKLADGKLIRFINTPDGTVRIARNVTRTGTANLGVPMQSPLNAKVRLMPKPPPYIKRPMVSYPGEIARSVNSLVSRAQPSLISQNLSDPMTITDSLRMGLKEAKAEVLSVEPGSSKPSFANQSMRLYDRHTGPGSCFEDDPCAQCVKSLSTVRKGLTRLESQMEMMTEMVTQIASRITQKQVHAVVPMKNGRPDGRALRGNLIEVQQRPASGAFPPSRPLAVPSSLIKRGITATAVAASPRALDSTTMKSNDPMKTMVGYRIAKPVNDKSSASSLVIPKHLARLFLLRTGSSFKLGEFLSENDDLTEMYTDRQIEMSLKELAMLYILKRTDPSLPWTDKEAVFEKAPAERIRRALSNFGITAQEYAATMPSS